MYTECKQILNTMQEFCKPYQNLKIKQKLDQNMSIKTKVIISIVPMTLVQMSNHQNISLVDISIKVQIFNKEQIWNIQVRVHFYMVYSHPSSKNHTLSFLG